MKDQYITLETAKLAKEKGFNYGDSYFNDDGSYNGRKLGMYQGNEYNGRYWRSTQSLLQKWLREVHGFEIQIFTMGIFMNKSTTPFSEFTLKKYQYVLNADHYYNGAGHDTYEESLEAALQKALKLIE